MPASVAQVSANRRNAERSTGPKTREGKDRSRANSLKHGMTGAGVVLPQADAAEVERRAAAFAEETQATGEIGLALARRAALNSVRMERGADQQGAALTERVRQVEADFVPPEGVDAAEADRLRLEAARVAMFDPSKEATLARQYEAAAERGFFRALKELRQRERQARAESRGVHDPLVDGGMGSFLEQELASEAMDDQFAALYAELNVPMPRRPAKSPHPAPSRVGNDLPIAVSRPG